MKPLMGIQEILNYLPHRPPFLLIDRVIEMEEGKSIVALKNVSMNEPYFVGHFPAKPVMPGVLMLEALAQAGTVLAYKSTNTSPSQGIIYYFAGVDEARFRRIVEPGDQLRLEVTLLRAKQNIWKLSGKILVDDEVACTAILLSAKGG